MRKPEKAVQLSCVLTEAADRWMPSMGRMICVRRDGFQVEVSSHDGTTLSTAHSAEGGFLIPRDPAIKLYFFPNVERESYASLAGVYCSETGRSFPFRMQRERHTALPCRSTVRFELSIHFGWNLRTFFPTGEFNIAREVMPSRKAPTG